MESGHSSSTWDRTSRYVLWAGAAAATLPLTVIYFMWIWQFPHYQFYPIVLVCVFWVLWARMKEWRLSRKSVSQPAMELPSTTQSLLGYLMIWLGIACEMLAISIFSPLAGYMALWLIGAGLITLQPPSLFRQLIGPWALLLILVRLPLNLDSILILQLQNETSKLASVVLDWLGIDHLREGIVIELTGKVMFVEEACSGVQSLFSLLALAGLLSLWWRRPLIHATFLFVSAAFGAGVMNIIRIVAVCAAYERWNMDLLAEPNHTILGLLVFVGSLLWLLSCDQFLSFWFSAIPYMGDSQKASALSVRWWNSLVGGGSSVAGDQALADRRKAGSLDSFTTGGVCFLMGCLAVFSIVLHREAAIAASTVTLSAKEEQIISAIKALDENSMPERFGDWQRAEFRTVERGERDMFGKYSTIWTYYTPGGPAFLSVDFPFTGWHDLRVCYTNTGWEILETGLCGLEDKKTPVAIDATITKGAAMKSYVVYGLTTFGFENLSARLSESVWDRLNRRNTDNVHEHSRTVQFQVFMPDHMNLTPEVKQDAQKHLAEFQHLVQKLVGGEQN